MFASKSTELIKIANRYKSIGKNILAINHKINNRYNTCNISTHDKITLDDCLILENLSDIDLNAINNYDIILIEELQFFPDAFDFITKIANQYDKIIIAAGLDGDFQGNIFGDVCQLIPHAEKVTRPKGLLSGSADKLSALCKICADGTPAYFTKRIVEKIKIFWLEAKKHIKLFVENIG